MTNHANFNLGPIKLKAKGLSTGALVFWTIVLVLAWLALYIFLFTVWVQNFMLISSGSFNDVNVAWLLFASIFLISAATSHTKSE